MDVYANHARIKHQFGIIYALPIGRGVSGSRL